MSDLVIEVDVIERMRTNLGRVRREFENANDNATDAAEAVGHRYLAERVSNFAQNWDNRRRDLVEQIQTIEEQIDNIQEQFDVVDTELGSSLDGDS